MFRAQTSVQKLISEQNLVCPAGLILASSEGRLDGIKDTLWKKQNKTLVINKVGSFSHSSFPDNDTPLMGRVKGL